MFTWLKKLFSEKQGLSRGQSTFLLLDPDKVVENFGIDRKAKEQGKKNLPPSNAVGPDDIEKALEAEINAVEAKQGENFSNRLRAHQQSVRGLTQDIEKVGLEAKITKKFGDASASIRNCNQTVFQLKAQLTNQFAQYYSFQRENNLYNTHPRNQGKGFLKISILIGLIVFEGIMNAFFYGQAQEGGLLGGFGLAAIIAILNCATSFFVGFKVFTYFDHVKKSRKILALLGFVAWVLFVIIINLGAGHYRDVASAMLSADAKIENVQSVEQKNKVLDFKSLDDDPGRVTLTKFINSPFDLKDIFSWLLCIFGVLFAIIALIDGYKFDDPYPQYGSLHREKEKTIEALRELLEVEQESFEEQFDEIDDEFQNRLRDIGQRDLMIEKYNQNILKIKADFDASQAQIAKSYEAAINKYRSLNMEARTDKPPSFFDKECIYKRVYSIEGGIDNQLISETREQLGESREFLPRLIKRINSTRKELSEGIPKFEEILKDAQKKIQK